MKEGGIEERDRERDHLGALSYIDEGYFRYSLPYESCWAPS